MVVALVLGPVLAVTPASADSADKGLVSVTKSVLGKSTLGPGDTATFQVVIGCASANTDGCADVALSDPVPAPLVLNTGSVLVVGTSDYVTTTTANTVAVQLTEAYGSGTGLAAGESVSVTYTATLPAVTTADNNGTLTNVATVTATGVEVSPVSSSADVTLAVPTTLAAQATKSFSPAVVAAVAGTQVDLTLGAVRNTSNTSVDSLVAQDPSDLANDPFALVAPTAVTALTLPTGADRYQLDWYVAGAWQTGTAQAVPADLTTIAVPTGAAGVRVQFTSSAGHLPVGSSGGSLTVRTAVRTSATSTTTLTDVASSWVVLGATTSTPTTTSAAVELDAPDLGPVVTKSFADADLTSGDGTQVTVESHNGDYPVATMTVQEPSGSQPDLAAQGLTFDGFVAASVQWPVGATAAQVSYVYGDLVSDGHGGSTPYTEGPKTTSTADTLPPPTAGHHVVGFTVTYTGSIAAHAYAVVPFAVTSGSVSTDTSTTNHVTGTVETAAGVVGTASASAGLTVRAARVATSLGKSISPARINGYAGSDVLVQLPAQVSGSPASTVGADQLTVEDGDATFFDSFDLAAIVPTSVAAGVRLRVLYRDSTDTSAGPAGTWKPYAVVSGPTTYSSAVAPAVAAVANGVRFVFEPLTGLLAPGLSVQPNVVAVVRSDLRSDAATPVVGTIADGAGDVTLTDTATSTVTSPTAVPSSSTASTSAQVVVRARPDGAGLDLIDKQWLDGNGTASDDGATVSARSAAQRTARLLWSTQWAPVTTMTLTDAPSDPADVADSVYDTFDLVRIAPITTASDPLITFDEVTAVERYSAAAGAWVATTWGGCPSACDGRFPGYSLTTAERADTLGVRLVLAESPTRSARIDSDDDPIVGSGVAASSTRRPVDLVMAVRDTRRSAPAVAVLGSSHDVCYDVPGCSPIPGQTGYDQRGRVQNDASAQATGPAQSWTASDSARITLLDATKTVAVTTSWDQTDLGVPPAGTPAQAYPMIAQTLTATSTTPVPVDELSVQLPDASTSAPSAFEVADLVDLRSITVPTGASTTTVRLWRGAASTDYTLADALALTADDLADVTGLTVLHDGRVQPGAATTVVLDFRLRATARSDGSAIMPGASVDDAVLAQVKDPVSGSTGADSATAVANASFSLAAASYGVTASKVIAPASRTEADANRTVTVTMQAQPTGNVRTTQLTFTDATPTFWNAYAFTSFSPMTLQTPIAQVRVEALVDVTYSLTGSTLTSSCPLTSAYAATDCWVAGLWQTAVGGTVTPVLPAGVSAADVRGLRLSLRSADGSGWERPRNPVATSAFVATRRDALVYGPGGSLTTPVPSTLSTLDPAPGESVRGTTTDTLAVHGTGAWDAPSTGTAWVGDATASASALLTHLTTATSVAITPAGDVLPGQDIPFVLTATNTGQRDLADLDYVARVATDTNGPLLVVPTRAPGDSAPVLTVTMRTSDGTVTSPAFVASPIAPDGTWTFTPPAGFVLPQGATLTIKAALQYRSDLPASTDADVSFEVLQTDTARPFDTCAWTASGVAGAPTTDQLTCTSTTTVRSIAATPIRLSKGVRGVGAGDPTAASGDADFNDLGVRNTATGGLGTACAGPQMDGAYYTTPCVPITRAGGTEQWKVKLANVGNVLATTISSIDVLPAVGDKAVILNQARSSRWSATLASGVTWAGSAGATATAYYLTSVPTTVCNRLDILRDTQGSISAADVKPTQYPGESDTCLTDVASRAWTVLPATPDAATLASVRALKLVVVYPTAAVAADQTGLAPQQVVSATYSTTTAAFASQAETGGKEPIAWNSAAVGSLGFDVSAGGPTPASPVLEPPKTGVALATGSLSLSKSVALPDKVTWAGAVPTSFTATLSCTSAGASVPIVGTTPGADLSLVTLPADGTPVPVDDGGAGTWGNLTVPMFAQCSVAETPSQGAVATYSPTSVVAVRDLSARSDVHHGVALASLTPSSVQTLATTNTYSPAGFTVTKQVDEGTAVTAGGVGITHPGPFAFTASCTLNGVQVLAAADQSFTLTAGQTRSVTALPAGASCQVVEATSGGAGLAVPTVVVTGGLDVNTATARTAAFTLTADQDGAPTTSVSVTNSFTAGTVQVTKAFAGAGAGTWNDHDVTVHLSCTLASASPSVVYDADHTFTRANGTSWQASDLVWTVANVATGATCAVTEPVAGNGGATSTAISPTSVSVGAATTVGVTVTNTFGTGSVKVTKALAGSLATSMNVAKTAVYTVSLSCTRTVNGTVIAVAVPGGATRTITGASSATYSGLPAGATCTVNEPDPGFASSSKVSPSSVGVWSGGTSNVTVTNTFDGASLAVTKAVTGSGWSKAPATYQVTLGCTWHGETVPLPSGGVVTLARGAGDGVPGAATTVSNIPDGSTCTVVSEVAQTGQVSNNLASITPVTVTTASTATLAVVNTFALADVWVTKSLAAGPLVAGNVARYRLTLGDDGPSDAAGVQVVDSLPAGLSFAGGVTSSAGAGWTTNAGLGATSLTFTRGAGSTLTAGATEWVEFDVLVGSAVSGTVTNSATISTTTAQWPGHRSDSSSLPSPVTLSGALALDKAVSPGTASVGQQVTYTVSVLLPKDSAYLGVRVDDVAAAHVALSSAGVAYAGGWATTPSVEPVVAGDGSGLTLDLGDLPASSTDRTVTLTYQGTVLDDAAVVTGAVLVNTATVHATNPAGTALAASDTASVAVVEPALTVTKRVDGVGAVQVDAGGTVTYTLTVHNGGTATAYRAAVRDQVPTGVRIVSTGGGTLSGQDATTGGGVLTFPDLTLAAGASTTYTYTGQLVGSTVLGPQALVNTGKVASYSSGPGAAGGFDPTQERSYGSVQDTAAVTPLFPSPTLSKSAGATAVDLGRPVTFTVRLHDAGAGSLAGSTLVDTLPPGWVYEAGSATLDGVATDEPAIVGQELTWAVGPTASAGDHVLTYAAHADPDHAWTTSTTGGAARSTNVVTVAGTDGSGATGHLDDHGLPVDYTASADASVAISRVDLRLDKSVVTTDPVAGLPLTWQLDVTNLGPDAESGPIEVADTLPASLAVTDAAQVGVDGDGWQLVGLADGVLTLRHAGVLGAGDRLPAVRLTVTVPADAAGATSVTLDNTAVVHGPTLDLDLANNTSTTSTGVPAAADLALVKHFTSATFVAGEQVAWAIDVTNLGPSVSAAPVDVTDTLPEGIDPASVVVTGTGWTLAGTEGRALTLHWSGPGALAVGAGTTVQATGTVASGYLGVALTNTAAIAGTSTPQPPEATANDTSSSTVLDSPTSADVWVTKTLTSPQLVAGGTARYRITVGDDGPSDAQDVELVDQVPAGLHLDRVVGDSVGGAWSVRDVVDQPDGSSRVTLVRDPGALSAGSSEWVDLDLLVDPGMAGSVTNQVHVQTSTAQPDGGRPDDASTTDPVVVRTDVGVTKTHDTAVRGVGDQVVFTLTVTNHGPADAHDVVLTDQLPAGLTVSGPDGVIAAGSDWASAAVDGDGVLTARLADVLPPGSSRSVQLVAVLGSAAVPSVTNTASVSTTTPDTDASDDVARDTVPVDVPALTMSKSAGAELVGAGSTVHYTIVVANTGAVRTGPVTVADPLGAGLELTGASWRGAAPGTSCGSDGHAGVSCTLGDGLAAGAAATLDVSARVRAGSGVVPNRAQATGTDQVLSQVLAASDAAQVRVLPAVLASTGGRVVSVGLLALVLLAAGLVLLGARRRLHELSEPGRDHP